MNSTDASTEWQPQDVDLVIFRNSVMQTAIDYVSQRALHAMARSQCKMASIIIIIIINNVFRASKYNM